MENTPAYPSAELFREIQALAYPPIVTVGENALVLSNDKANYGRIPRENPEFDAFKDWRDVELAKIAFEQEKIKSALTFEQSVEKEKLAFNKVSAFGGISSLDGLCAMLRAEIRRNAVAPPIFVSVSEYNEIVVFGSYEVDFTRKSLYMAKSDNSDFSFGADILGASDKRGSVRALTPEEAIIVLQSKFVPGDDVGYVVDTLSSISSDAEVKNVDNGLSQSVTMRSGISMAKNERIQSRVSLRPYRTFIEVEQPLTEYLLRLHKQNDEVAVTLTPADGGAWILAAKSNIAAYLADRLSDFCASGDVIVTV